jgi:hypothetical protein
VLGPSSGWSKCACWRGEAMGLPAQDPACPAPWGWLQRSRVAVPEATLGRGCLVARILPMWRWLRTGAIRSIVLEQRGCRCQTEMRRGMLLARTYGLSFCPGLGELSCAVSQKVAVLLCCDEGRRLRLLVTAREERPWAASSLVARRQSRSPSRAGLLVTGAAERLRCLRNQKPLGSVESDPFVGDVQV